MANLNETPNYETGIYQIETIDPIIGGAGGVSNRQATQLGNRTAYLKQALDALTQSSAQNDTTLQNNINALTQASQDKDNHLQSLIDTLTQNSAQGDTTLQNNINALTQASQDKGNHLQSLIDDLQQSKTTHFNANQPLPSTNIGPIWHDLYNSWMTWQVFNQNGANYAGYASVDIGQVFASSQPTSRQGYVGFGMNISKSAHPAIYHRAKHLGQLKAPAQWQPKTIEYRENANGTITVPDLRGVHERYWDAGAGINSGRGFGSYEADNIKKHDHMITVFSEQAGQALFTGIQSINLGQPNFFENVGLSYINPIHNSGGEENTVKNTAFFGEIKL